MNEEILNSDNITISINGKTPFYSTTKKGLEIAKQNNLDFIQIKKKYYITKLDEFIEMNPAGEHTQYAQYLLAMSYYVQIPDAGRDPMLSEKALRYFKIVTTKFPNSVYAKDAKFKINFIKNSKESDDSKQIKINEKNSQSKSQITNCIN